MRADQRERVESLGGDVGQGDLGGFDAVAAGQLAGPVQPGEVLFVEPLPDRLRGVRVRVIVAAVPAGEEPARLAGPGEEGDVVRFVPSPRYGVGRGMAVRPRRLVPAAQAEVRTARGETG